MRRILFFVYGVVNYLLFLGTVLYLACFLGNVFVARSIDSPPEGPLGEALLINFGLLAIFAIQHSVMARPGFKKWWTKFVPQPIERSTYVLFSNLALILLCWQWRPMGGVIWDVQNPVGRLVIYGLFVLGLLAVVATTFLLNHFDLFGLRQVWLYLQDKPYTPLSFATPGPYRFIRHPLYIGWMVAFWATPTMTVAHLVFAIGTTVYMLMAIPFEERDLGQFHGDKYKAYRRKVPMLIPAFFKKKPKAEEAIPETTIAR